MVEPEFPVATVIFVGVVTEEVPTGFVVFQVKLVLQELPAEAIVQLEAVRVPDIEATVTGVPTVELLPPAFVQYKLNV